MRVRCDGDVFADACDARRGRSAIEFRGETCAIRTKKDFLDLSNSTNQLSCMGSIVLCIAQVEHARDKTGKVCVYRTRGGAETSEFAESEVRRLIIVLPLELERARVPRCVWRVRARVHAQTNSLMTDVLYARLIS